MMSVTWIIFFYALQGIVLLIILLLARRTDKRIHHRDRGQVPPGFQETNEVMKDPVDQKKRRVYYNPATGERFYKVMEENLDQE